VATVHKWLSINAFCVEHKARLAQKKLHGQPRIPDPRLAAPMCSRNAGCCCWVQRELANVGHQFGTPSMIFDGCTDLVAKYSYGYHFATPWVICWIQQNLCRISTVYSALFGTSPWWQAQGSKPQTGCSQPGLHLTPFEQCYSKREQKRWVWNRVTSPPKNIPIFQLLPFLDPPGGVIDQYAMMYYDVLLYFL
jgi:hypothetical protein